MQINTRDILNRVKKGMQHKCPVENRTSAEVKHDSEPTIREKAKESEVIQSTKLCALKKGN